MLDKFELLLDLLDIEDRQNYLEIAQQIEKSNYKKIKTFHKYGFLFEGFDDLLKENLSLEAFLQLGDVESNIDIAKMPGSFESLIADVSDGTLLIVSRLYVSWKNSSKQIDVINDSLAHKASRMILL